jgi:hypothetical protein
MTDPFETALNVSGIVTPPNDPDANAPTLDDAVTNVSSETAPNTAPSSAPAAPSAAQLAIDELSDELTDDVLLEAIALGFTTGLPMSQEERGAFSAAYADSKIVKIGMKLTGLKDVAGGGLARAIESNPFVRIGVGALLMLGSGAIMRGQYVQQLNGQAAALAAGGRPDPRPDAGFSTSDLPEPTAAGPGEGVD